MTQLVDAESWRQEIPQIEQHYARIGERLPDELRDELRELEKRLAN
jgi:phosphoenolpyruvate carboxykinase (GTP)